MELLVIYCVNIKYKTPFISIMFILIIGSPGGSDNTFSSSLQKENLNSTAG